MNTEKNYYVGVPKETRLHDDVMPILNELLQLKEGDYGMLRSQLPAEQSLLKRVSFVRRRMGDIIRGLGEGKNYIGGVLSDERALEANLEAENIAQNPFGERVCGIATNDPEKKISQLRFLVKAEELEAINQAGGLHSIGARNGSVCISSFPNIAEHIVRGSMSIEERDGQLESILRSDEIPGAFAILDLVSSGKTAAQFNLITIGEPVLTAYPSIWSPVMESGDTRASVVADFNAFLIEKLGQRNDIRLTQTDAEFLGQPLGN